MQVLGEELKKPLGISKHAERFTCPLSFCINPYGGCTNECPYCFAKFIQTKRKQWHIRPGNVAYVRQLFSEALDGNHKSAIHKMIKRRTPIRMASITDPFMHAELDYRVTYQILQILAEYNYPVLINTKGSMMTDRRYMELFEEMPVIIQFSFSTDEDFLAAKLEPGAPAPSERMKALKACSEAGIITQMRFSPILPILSDEPERLLKWGSDSGAKDVIFEFLRMPVAEEPRQWVNDALGFDYLELLRESGFAMESKAYWWRAKKPFIYEEYARYQDLAGIYGLNSYVCSEGRPEMNKWGCCCGTDRYKGFENPMRWATAMNGHKIGDQPISFEDYIKGTECPYENEFKRRWNSGALVNAIDGMYFEYFSKTYARMVGNG